MTEQKTCRYHPDRPAVALCQKNGHGLCAECLEDAHCFGPELYCKYRTQCIIFYTEKENRRARRKQSAAGA